MDGSIERWRQMRFLKDVPEDRIVDLVTLLNNQCTLNPKLLHQRFKLLSVVVCRRLAILWNTVADVRVQSRAVESWDGHVHGTLLMPVHVEPYVTPGPETSDESYIDQDARVTSRLVQEIHDQLVVAQGLVASKAKVFYVLGFGCASDGRVCMYYDFK